MMKVFRSLAVWLMIILAESIHGTIRTVLVEPLVGGHRARQLSVVTGALIFFFIALKLIRWTEVRSVRGLVAMGASWVFLTIAFEFALGMLVLGMSYERLLADYDIANGGLMPIGLAILLFTPLFAYRVTRGNGNR